MESFKLTDLEKYEFNIYNLLTINDNWNLNNDELFKLCEQVEFIENFKVFKYNPLITNEVEFKENDKDLVCYVKGLPIGLIKTGKVAHLKNVIKSGGIKEIKCEISCTTCKSFADWEIDEDDPDYEYAQFYKSLDYSDIYILSLPGSSKARIDITMFDDDVTINNTNGKVVDFYERTKIIGCEISGNDLTAVSGIKIGDRIDLQIDYRKNPAIETYYNGIKIGCLGATRQDELKKYVINNKYYFDCEVYSVFKDSPNLYSVKINIKVIKNDI